MWHKSALLFWKSQKKVFVNRSTHHIDAKGQISPPTELQGNIYTTQAKCSQCRPWWGRRVWFGACVQGGQGTVGKLSGQKLSENKLEKLSDRVIIHCKMPGALHQAVPDPWNLVDVLNNPLHSARQPSRRVDKQIQMGQQSESTILQTQKFNAGCVTTRPTWRCSSGWSTVSISFAASSCSSSLCARSIFSPVCLSVIVGKYIYLYL